MEEPWRKKYEWRRRFHELRSNEDNYNNRSDDKADTYLLDVVGGNENGAWCAEELELMSSEDATEEETPAEDTIGWI